MHPVTRSLIRRTPSRFRPAAVLVLRTIDDAFNDRVPGLAAEIAFFLVLSLVPLLLALLGTVGFAADLIGADVTDRIVQRLTELSSNVFSPDTVDGTIRPLLADVVREGRGDIATFGFILTFFSASRALRVVSTAITIAYDLEESRPGWQQRLWGLGLTAAGIVVALGVVPLLVLGPGFGEAIERSVGVSGIAAAWATLYWPVAVVVASVLVATLYHLVAPWWTPWRRDLPGAVLAVVLFLLGSVGLRLYTSSSFGAEAGYAQFAAPLAGLLWLWVSSIALLLGAEFNAEIERLWPTTSERAEHDGVPIEHLRADEIDPEGDLLGALHEDEPSPN